MAQWWRKLIDERGEAYAYLVLLTAVTLRGVERISETALLIMVVTGALTMMGTRWFSGITVSKDGLTISRPRGGSDEPGGNDNGSA